MPLYYLSIGTIKSTYVRLPFARSAIVLGYGIDKSSLPLYFSDSGRGSWLHLPRERTSVEPLRGPPHREDWNRPSTSSRWHCGDA